MASVSEIKDSNAIKVDLDISSTKDVGDEVVSRIGASRIRPELVAAEKINAPQVYKRFTDTNKKNAFREKLLGSLEKQWIQKFGPENSEKLVEGFKHFAKHLDEKGAVIFGALLCKENFKLLIDQYTKILKESGSKSWIHSYVNLANHPQFLTNKAFNAAFLHPLLIALISYRVGGPIRVVDGRGKDAEPIKVLAQDNMLHIDNTPFNDEYKVILTWERGKPSGPKGQNFVFLPGTQKGARQCMMGKDGKPWSSENASIFTTPDAIDQVFKFQETILKKRAVVELSHDTKPLTTLFAAGSLVHHRYRTAEGLARSCTILAFHRAEDNPGQLVAPEHLVKTAAKTDALYQLLFGHNVGSEDVFLSALMNESGAIAELFQRLEKKDDEVEEIKPEARELSSGELKRWKQASTEAPTVEEKKIEAAFVPLHQTLSRDDFVDLVGKMMVFDKHGPLDLILYPDAHEEIRKWARNQIREKNIDQLKAQLKGNWSSEITQPNKTDLLLPSDLQKLTHQLAKIAQIKIDLGGEDAVLRKGEKISSLDAYRSVKQLLLDLGESIVRCEDRGAFLSTSLFIFWAADTLMGLDKKQNPEIKAIGKKLLANYISTGILVEQHIESETSRK